MKDSPSGTTCRSAHPPELVCSRCGRLFDPHCVGEGDEDLCCDCYEQEFAQSFDYDEASV
jgi:hypothetical protein